MYDAYRLNQIESVPEETGLYAWYYQIMLSDKDIQVCINDLNNTDDTALKKKIAETFLEEKIFKYYMETPYKVSIDGALKPKYAGNIEYVPNISESAIIGVVENPEILRLIKKALIDSVPRFSSPIYIGMATNLRTRLGKHKKLIEKYLNLDTYEFEKVDDSIDFADQKDHSFAKEVSIVRKFNTANLVVYVRTFQDHRSQITCMENIFNRIYYPLCGRN